MFNIIPNPTFTHDVTVMTPADGGFAEETIRTTYNYLDVEALQRYDLSTAAGTSACLEALVAKLDGLVGAGGEPVACTPELRDKLLRMNNVRQAILRHYFEAVGKVKEGN